MADNKLALNARWDQETLAIELQALIDLDFDVGLTGFSLAEIDFTLDSAGERAPEGSDAAGDQIPAMRTAAVTKVNQLWTLGRHRLLCGDARKSDVYISRLRKYPQDCRFFLALEPIYGVFLRFFTTGRPIFLA